jgi:CRISPR/Cas system-associated exonuclease Cas4 (RecB family)
MPAKTIGFWSFSRLQVFEKCPYQYKLKFIDKVPEPENPFSARGVEVHSAHEDYVTGKRPDIHAELAAFSAEMNSLRERHKVGQVEIEEEWAFDNKWQRTDWRDYDRTWVRIKLDAKVNLTEDTALVIDGKTGRKYGNEIKHAEQGQLYAGATFLRQPTLKKVMVEFHYWDQKGDDRLTHVEYKPALAAKAILGFERRAIKMLSAAMYPPRPNIFNCSYCSYGRRKGNGHCKVGV